MKIVTIQDIDSLGTSSEGVLRQSIASKKILLGTYEEFDSYSLGLSLSFLPNEDDDAVYKGGYSFFATRLFNDMQNKVDMGFVYFVTKKQEKTGQRTPIIGFTLQANDMFDEADKGNTLDERLTISITSTISLNSLFK